VLLTTDAVGGVWRYSLELAHGLAECAGSVGLAVLGPAPDPAQCQEAAAIPGLALHVTGLPLDWTAETSWDLRHAAEVVASLAGRVRADSVQLHAPALMGSATWPAPVIVTAHSCVGTWWDAVRGGSLPTDLAWRGAATADGLHAADAVIAPSASFAAALRTRYRLRRHIHVVPNGRRPLSAAADRRSHVLTAGRLWDPGKGIATLDAAARHLRHPVYAAGPVTGPNGASITCRHLRLLGALHEADLARAYAEAAVFASAARYEPFGLAVLEAAQAGCALVLSDIPTFRELWHGAAMFVPPDDPAALASTLAIVLDNPSARTRLSAAARGRATRFDPRRMAATTMAVHHTVLAREAA
jgi:glycosyltransferase involved in cell wall biosynthesis